MTPRRTVTAVVLVLTLACGRASDSLSPPTPRLPQGLAEGEAAIRDDLETRHAALIDAVESGEVTASALAARYGDLGISLFAHGFYAEAAEALRSAGTTDPAQFRWHYYFAHAVRRTGDMESAAAGFENALGIDEHSLAARLWLAETRLHREQLEEAEAAFSRSLEQDPHCAQAWTGLGRIHLSRGQYSRAVEYLEGALERRPDSPPARYSLALALRGLGRVQEARTELDRLEGENHSLIITCFEDPLMQEVRHRQTGTRAHEGRAKRAREEGRLTTALVELRAAVRANPNRYPARYDIATLLIRIGRPDEGQRELETLLELAPDYTAALTLLARMEARSGNWRRAEELLAHAAAVDPGADEVHLANAELLHEASRFAEALAAYERALAIDPTLVSAIVGRALCLTATDRSAEALEYLREREAALPTRPQLTLTRAHLLLLDGTPAAIDRALELSRVQVTENPTVGAIEVLATALAMSGRSTEAVEWQQRLLRDLPTGPPWAQHRKRASDRLKAFQSGRAPRPQVDFASAAMLARGPLAFAEGEN